jgi:hypothetical protein
MNESGYRGAGDRGKMLAARPAASLLKERVFT